MYLEFVKILTFCLHIKTIAPTIYAGQMARKVYVEKQLRWLTNPYYYLITEDLDIFKSNIFALSRHLDHLLVCTNDEDNTRMYAKIQVSPLYVNSSEGYLCFTRLKEDLAVHSLLKTSPTYAYWDFEKRWGIKLVDGINRKEHEDIMNLAADLTIGVVYFTINLGERNDIGRLVMTPMQEDVFSSQYPHHVTIKIGQSQHGWDYNLYSLFASYNGGMVGGQDAVILPNTGSSMSGQYVFVKYERSSVITAADVALVQGGGIVLAYVQIFEQ